MSLRIGDTTPNFQVETTKGQIDFHEFVGNSWVFFFSHPADFTPVCTTEMGRTAQLAEEFSKRNCKPLGLSTDSVEEHVKWVEDVDDTQQTKLDFPIVADPDLRVSKLYDMIHPEGPVRVTLHDPSLHVRVFEAEFPLGPTTSLVLVHSPPLQERVAVAVPPFGPV